jgi:hypothetical protein
VNGAGADNDEKSVALAKDNVGSILAALDNGVCGLLGERDLGGEKSGRNQRILSEDWFELAAVLGVTNTAWGGIVAIENTVRPRSNCRKEAPCVASQVVKHCAARRAATERIMTSQGPIAAQFQNNNNTGGEN